MKLFVLLIALSFGAKENKNVAESDESNEANVNDREREPILVKIEEDEYDKVNVANKKSLRNEHNLTNGQILILVGGLMVSTRLGAYRITDLE